MRRTVVVGAAAAAFATALALWPLKPAVVTGQAQTVNPALAPAKGADIKTAWGEPDLQGIWTDISATPLQRNPKYGTKETFTEEERAELDTLRAKRLDHDYRAERGTENDVAGAYNAVYHLRKRTGKRTSLIVDPPDGRMPAYVPDVAKRQAAWRAYDLALMQATKACKNQEAPCQGGKYGPPHPLFFGGIAPFYPFQIVNRSDDPEDRGLGERCLGGSNVEFGNVNGFSRRIVQTRGDISIYHDSGQGQGWQRNVVMNGSPHLPPSIRQWWGDARGHWEGNTLVIDTTNFSPKSQNLQARENLHIIERLTRTGPDTIEYIITIEDPTTWTKPWTVKQEYTRQSDEENRFFIEPRCHEGNYGLMASLRGARTLDEEFVKGLGPNPAEIYIAPTSAEKLGATDEEVDEALAF